MPQEGAQRGLVMLPELVSREIADLGELIHKNMAFSRRLIAYFDESGKLHDSTCVVFGGCVFDPPVLEAVLAGWLVRLRQDGLEATSMKEAVWLRGTFASWKGQEARRDALLLDLAAMIQSRMLRIASTIHTAEFIALPETDRRRLGNDPQYAAFEACVRGIWDLPERCLVHIVCDLSEEYSARTVALFHKLRRLNEVARLTCPLITFADDHLEPGLQMADMVAYCARAELLKATTPVPPIVERLIGIFGMADQKASTMYYRYGSLGLGHGELE